MIRRSLTPSVGIPVAGLPPVRRAGGTRHNVSYRVTLHKGGAEMPGWALNVSHGGLRAALEDRVELGDEVDVQINDEDARRKGRVVWVQEEPDGTIAGISFLERLEEPPPGVELETSVNLAPGQVAQALAGAGVEPSELDAILAGGDEAAKANSDGSEGSGHEGP